MVRSPLAGSLGAAVRSGLGWAGLGWAGPLQVATVHEIIDSSRAWLREGVAGRGAVCVYVHGVAWRGEVRAGAAPVVSASALRLSAKEAPSEQWGLRFRFITAGGFRTKDVMKRGVAR